MFIFRFRRSFSDAATFDGCFSHAFDIILFIAAIRHFDYLID